MGLGQDMAADARGREEGPTMIVLRSDRQRAPVMRAKYGAMFGGEVQVTSTAPHFVDFLHHEAGKDRALVHLCRSLGIPLQRVIAIGDGINDLDMIGQAGLGVLVGNAAVELWPHADIVTKARYAEGIAEVIERFCLK
jgi:hydroxymethylpyrimidine pyrophosphatase-like HAD family hydrolase